MTKKTHDLCVKTGNYTDREGNDKGRWLNVGALMEDKEGRPFIMLNACFNPAGIQREEGRESILVSCFEPQQDQQEQRQPQRPAAQKPAPRRNAPGSARSYGSAGDDGDVPF